MEAIPAARFIDILFTEQNGFTIWYQSKGMCGEITAVHADGVELGDILRNSKQFAHGSKRFSSEVHVESGDDNPMTAQCQRFTNGSQSHIEKLGLVNTYHIGIIGSQQDFF